MFLLEEKEIFVNPCKDPKGLQIHWRLLSGQDLNTKGDCGSPKELLQRCKRDVPL